MSAMWQRLRALLAFRGGSLLKDPGLNVTRGAAEAVPMESVARSRYQRHIYVPIIRRLGVFYPVFLIKGIVFGIYYFY